MTSLCATSAPFRNTLRALTVIDLMKPMKGTRYDQQDCDDIQPSLTLNYSMGTQKSESTHLVVWRVLSSYGAGLTSSLYQTFLY